MNRRIRCLTTFRDHCITMAATMHDDPKRRTFWMNSALNIQSYLSWLTDDHRARRARFAMKPMRGRHPVHDALPDANQTWWCQGVPHTHNSSLQTYRRCNLSRRAKPNELPLSAFYPRKVRLWIWTETMRSNLLCSR